MRNSGHDPAKIRAVLGWMDEEIQDNYTHWEAEHLRRWAEIVDEIWRYGFLVIPYWEETGKFPTVYRVA